MSNEELLKHFEQYLNVTRPERQTRQPRHEQQIMKLNPKYAAGVALAKSLGINMPIFADKLGGRKK